MACVREARVISSRLQDDKNYYIISDYYMGGDVQACCLQQES